MIADSFIIINKGRPNIISGPPAYLKDYVRCNHANRKALQMIVELFRKYPENFVFQLFII